MLVPMNKTMRAVAKRNADGGGYFFTPEAMSFFNSRVESTAYRFNDREETVLFITSEAMDEAEPRQYTVRVASTHNATATNAYPVDSVGKFQWFDSLSEAFDFIGTIMDNALSVGMDAALWDHV